MFKDIEGYEGLYQIDENGVIFSPARQKGALFCKERYLKYDESNHGHYVRVTLCKNNRPRKYLLHRLVYLHFVGKIPLGMEVNHKDENKSNNHVSNLELMTSKENNHHSRVKLGYKLFKEDVEFIRSNNLTTKEVIDKYGISPRHALRVINGERWDFSKR